MKKKQARTETVSAKITSGMMRHLKAVARMKKTTVSKLVSARLEGTNK